MQQSQQFLLIQPSNAQKGYILINSSGIYTSKSNNINTQSKINAKNWKSIFELKKKLIVKVIKSQISEKQQLFVVRISQEQNSKDVVISGKQNLERFFKLTGTYSFVQGLQDLLTSFKKIGQGAFAQVFEAITNHNHRFALKSFEKKYFDDAKTKASFYNQVQLLKSLNSPYIVPFDYIFETQKAFYLKMQYLEINLKQKCATKLLIKKQKKYMKQLILALQQMEKKSIIHRDLKPDNVMIRTQQNGEEECVIIDFGLATHVDAKQYLFVRCGTPGFLAPQIANCSSKKQRQTCAIDMYSLGCIFFKMITGHYLFGGKTSKQVLLHNKKGIYNKSFFSKLSQKENNLLVKMIETNPKTRITPQEAIKDPYFESDIDDSDEIAEQQCTINRNIQRISAPIHIKNMDSINSSCSSLFGQNSISSQAYKLKGRDSIKDSCITFQFGNNFTSEEELRSTNKGSSRMRTSKRSSSISKTQDKANMKASRFSKLPQDFSKII